MEPNWLKMRALVAVFSFELGPPHIDRWASGGSSEEITPKTCTRSARTRGDIVKTETSELNRKTGLGELNRNTNVNKMSYLAPAGTRTCTRAALCTSSGCALAAAAPLLAVQSGIGSCAQAFTRHAVLCIATCAQVARKLHGLGTPVAL